MAISLMPWSILAKIAKELNLFIIPKQKTIALADPTQHAKIIGETIVDISLEN